jgi:hypothetical protein
MLGGLFGNEPEVSSFSEVKRRHDFLIVFKEAVAR